MNKLLAAKRAQILLMLCEGWSMRSVSRIVNYNPAVPVGSSA